MTEESDTLIIEDLTLEECMVILASYAVNVGTGKNPNDAANDPYDFLAEKVPDWQELDPDERLLMLAQFAVTAIVDRRDDGRHLTTSEPFGTLPHEDDEHSNRA